MEVTTLNDIEIILASSSKINTVDFENLTLVTSLQTTC